MNWKSFIYVFSHQLTIFRCFLVVWEPLKRHSSYIVRILAECLLIINQPVSLYQWKASGTWVSHRPRKSPVPPATELSLRTRARKIWAFSSVHRIWPRILKQVHRKFWFVALNSVVFEQTNAGCSKLPDNMSVHLLSKISSIIIMPRNYGLFVGNNESRVEY